MVQQEQSSSRNLLRGFSWFIFEVHFLTCCDMRHAVVMCFSPFLSFFFFFSCKKSSRFLYWKWDYHQVSPWRIEPTTVFCYVSENKVLGWYTIKQQQWSCHSQPHYSSLSLVQLYTSTAKEDRWRSFGSCKPQRTECRTMFLSWFTPCSQRCTAWGFDWNAEAVIEKLFSSS